MNNERIDAWKMRRCGLITSSGLKDLMTEGTKGDKFGKKAINYLLEKKRERRTGIPCFNAGCYNFTFGHENEPRAVEWLRANTDLTVRSCTDDFEDIIFDIHPSLPMFGDSPDLFINDTDLGEIKCPASQYHFEMFIEMTAEEARKEYEYQLCGHFMTHPLAERLYLIIYDGVHDEDDFDYRSYTDASRGKVFTYSRDQFEDMFEKIENRIKVAWNFLEISEKQGIPLSKINDYLKGEDEECK